VWQLNEGQLQATRGSGCKTPASPHYRKCQFCITTFEL
jgi:hypothetical protein